MIFLSFCEDLLHDCASATARGWTISPVLYGRRCCPFGAANPAYSAHPPQFGRKKAFTMAFDDETLLTGEDDADASLLGLWFRHAALGALAIEEFGRVVVAGRARR
jgi:hypothetical protein